MKRSKIQWALAIVLALATVALGAVGATGYVMRSGDYVAEKMGKMRVYAVIRTAANGIIDDIAKKAKDEAKDWATAKNEETGEANIKGRDNQRAYYNEKADEARKAAEEQYSRFEGIDLSKLNENILRMEEAEKVYYEAERAEKKVYDAVYLKASELAGARATAWMGELENRVLTVGQLTEERVAAAEATYAELDEETRAGHAERFAQAATEISAAFGLASPAAETDGLQALTDVLGEARPLYEAMDEAARADLDARAAESMASLTRELGALSGFYWTDEAERLAQAEAFSGEAMAVASESYAAQYGELSAACEKGFDKAFQKLFLDKFDENSAVGAEETVSEDEIDDASSVKIDYAGFVGSAALDEKQAVIDGEYDQLWTAIESVLPNLTDDMKKDQQQGVEDAIYTSDNSFEAEYARYVACSATNALEKEDADKMRVASGASNMLLGAIALLVLTLVALFYQTLVKRLGVPRLIIGVFFIMLLILSGLYGLNMSSMMSNVLKRTGQYGILVLAMLPGIQCGISLNMGMTVGIVAGLLSTLIALECDMTGWTAFTVAVVLGCVFAAPIGWAYSKLLNKLKGNEMTVSTYVGFSFVSLMSIFWMILPFRNPKLTWALGTGLRVMHTMTGNIGGLLNNFLSFNVFGINVPTGLLLFLLLCCAALWLFSRSRTGTAMIAAGSNPRFAEAAGISVDRMRTIGTVVSTMVAAVGIIVYSQSFGFMQLYSGPRQMGFTAASAILIGGASTSRAKVSHVIIGTFLFQGVLSMGILVANQAISASGLSEVMRILISNGIILYALTQSGGEN